MMNGNSLKSISEDSTDFSSDGNFTTTEDLNNLDDKECLKYVRNFSKNEYLKCPIDKVKQCRDQLKRNRKLSAVDHQRVTCQILRLHFKPKEGANSSQSVVDLPFFIEELVKVNILEKDFFNFMHDLDGVDSEWCVQIFEALNEALNNSNPQEKDLLLSIPHNCHKLCQMAEKRLTHTFPLFKTLMESILRLLASAFKANLIFDTADGDTFKLIESILILGEKAGREKTFDFLVVKVRNILKFSDDIQQMVWAEHLLSKAGEIKRDSDTRSYLTDLRGKLRDKRRLANLDPDSKTSISSQPCDSEASSLHPETEKKMVRRKKKTKMKSYPRKDMSREADDLSLDEECAPPATNQNKYDYEIKDQTLAAETKNVDAVDCIVDFMDSVSFLPTRYEHTILNLEQKGLMSVQKEDVKAVEALWSVMQPLAHQHPDWRITNFSFADFKHRLDTVIPQWKEGCKELFNGVAVEFRVQIHLFSTLQPLIPDITITPGLTNFKSTICLLHTKKSRFRGIKKQVGSVPVFYEPIDTFPNEDEEEKTGVQEIKMNPKIKEVIRIASKLKLIQKADDFKMSSDSGKNPHYNMLNKAELTKRLKTEPAKYRRCRLHLQGPHEGLAEPVVDDDQKLDGSLPREGIVLRGRVKCGMTFEGDEVVVKMYRDGKGEVISGEVVGIWESPTRPVNQIFFCRVSQDQVTLMRPICSTVPKIHVANEPAERKYEETELHKERRLFDFHVEAGSATSKMEERKKKEYANRSLVSIFEVAVENGEVRFSNPKVEEVQRHTCNDIFVVVYKKWSPRYLYPFGHIIKRLPARLSIPDDVAILRLQNNLPHPFGIDITEKKAEVEAKKIAERKDSKRELENRQDFRDIPTVTIDNETTEDMDDALSFRMLPTGGFEVGVHITDVAHYIPRNSDLDLAARRRALSVYAKDLPAVHMLPPSLSTKRLSLVEGCDRLCLCVKMRFSEKNKLLHFDKSLDLKRTVIRSNRRMTKTMAAAVLSQEDTDIPLEIVGLLRRANVCAKNMRSERLKQSALSIQLDKEKFSEVLNSEKWSELFCTYEVEQLVEEFMVECNLRIGTLLHKQFGEHVVFREQPSPETQNVERWLDSHRLVARHSGLARQFLQLAGERLDDLGCMNNGPIISADMKKELERAKKNEDTRRAEQMLACDVLHPRIYAAVDEMWSISKRAQYALGSQIGHFSLNCRTYAQFTSPIRRYNDILIQRLVHRVLDGHDDPDIPAEDLQEIADICNERFSQMRHYQVELEVLQLDCCARQSPLSLGCVITDVSSPRLLLDHPIVRKLRPNARSVTDAHLNVRKLDRNEEMQKVRCTWQERLFIVDPSQREKHPNRRLPVSAPSPPQLQALERQYCFGRQQPGGLPPLPTLCKILLGNEGRRLLSGLTFRPVNIQAERVDDITSEVQRLDDLDSGASHTMRTQERKFVLDPAVTFCAEFRKYDSLRVQFGPARGRERGPSLSLVRLAPSFSLCLEHVTEPALAYGQVIGSTIPRRHESLEAYQDAWLPVLRMESIAESIDDENSFYLSGVSVHWYREDKKNGRVVLGAYELPIDFCSNPHRQLVMNADEDFNACLEPGEQDYVCVRIDLEKYVWVGHGGITFTSKNDKRYVQAFRLNDQTPALPREAIGRLATIQVIKKTMPKRRQERAVELLTVSPKSTAAAIAIGKIAEMVCHPFLAELSRKYYVSEGLFAAKCNEFQKSAIRNAFAWPISLIWGPPGTGKTVTGVQITFWFGQYNRIMKEKQESNKINTDSNEEDEKEDREEVGEKRNEECEDPRSRFQHVWNKWTTVEKPSRRRSTSGCARRRLVNPRSHPGPSNQRRSGSGVLEVHFPSVKVADPTFVELKDRKRQVLYCGPSNACVNCVAEHIRTKVVPGYLSIIRVFSEQVEAKEFRIPGEDISCSRFESDVEVPENLLEVSLHRLIRLPGRKYAKLLAEFDRGFKTVCAYLDGKMKNYNFLEVVIDGAPQNNDVDEYQKTQLQRIMEGIRAAATNYHSLLVAAKSEELSNHDVVICTTAVSSNLIVQNNCRFCQVIIDEAGMCTEPETLVPLVPVDENSASAAIENVVLIGDHKQLRPILKDKIAAELGLECSMLERHWEHDPMNADPSYRANHVMLKRQYRMHPSLCEFPSQYLYHRKLNTGVSQMWTGLMDDEIEFRGQWTGLNQRHVAKSFYGQVLENGNANVLHGTWPGVRRPDNPYRCIDRDALIDELYGEEERIVFLNVEGKEDNLTRKTAQGSENSKSNEEEIKEVLRIYMGMRKRFSQPRNALNAIAVLSQYQHQVNRIREKLTEKLDQARQNESKGTVAAKFLKRSDKFRRDCVPIVTSVVQSQGSEYDYVILSTVRSLPKHDINESPTPGWEKKYLGFITDINQINVALTRARKGLIIIGNGELLKVHKFWKSLIENLKERGCYVENSSTFSPEPERCLRPKDFPPVSYKKPHRQNFEFKDYVQNQSSYRGGRGSYGNGQGSYHSGMGRSRGVLGRGRGNVRGSQGRGNGNGQGP